MESLMPKLVPSKFKFSGDIMEISRKVLGLSQYDLAKAIGVTSATVYYWERGRYQPSPEYIPLLAKILKTKPHRLFLNVPITAPIPEPATVTNND